MELAPVLGSPTPSARAPVLLVPLLLPLLLLLAPTRADVADTALVSQQPFLVGSRYGRSSDTERIISPRNDKFFMGSRYGKRDGWRELGPHRARNHGPLYCKYTGVLTLYQCARRRSAPTDFMRTGAGASGAEMPHSENT